MCLVVIIGLLFVSCSSEGNLESGVVARVNNSTLTKKMLSGLVGDKLGDSKKLLHATNRWVEKTLLYNAAIKDGLKKDVKLIKQKEDFYKDLLISSYINIKTKAVEPISKKDISDYYNKNKKSFAREELELVVKHFVSTKNKEAENIKKTLRKHKKGKKVEKINKNHHSETRVLKESLLRDSLVGFVFNGRVGDVLGPKKHGGFYHVFKILKKHERGSIMGLELVYDEIYHRLYKQKEVGVLSDILDSLYLHSDVFISSGFVE